MSLDNYRTALLAAGHELSAYEKLLIILFTDGMYEHNIDGHMSN